MSLFSKPPEIEIIKFSYCHIVSVARALEIVWHNLKRTNFRDYKDENLVSAEIIEGLNNLLSEGNLGFFNYEIYETVVRDGKLKDYSGISIDQMPDITVRLAGKSAGAKTYVGLFIECKVLDNNRKINLYVENGVKRYVDGKYSWRMKQSMMVAYVYSKDKLPGSLKEYLLKSKSKSAQQCRPIGPITILNCKKYMVEICLTVHARNFLLKGGVNPGNIELNHFWLHY